MEIVMHGDEKLAKTPIKHKCMALPLYKSAPYSTFKNKTRKVNKILFFNFCPVVPEPIRLQHHGCVFCLYDIIFGRAGSSDRAV
jgi:hypothetical protein